jgi:hypothetical protein
VKRENKEESELDEVDEDGEVESVRNKEKNLGNSLYGGCIAEKEIVGVLGGTLPVRPIGEVCLPRLQG